MISCVFLVNDESIEAWVWLTGNHASLEHVALFIINTTVWLGGAVSKRQDVTLNIYRAVVKTAFLNYLFNPRSLHKYLAVGDRPNKAV